MTDKPKILALLETQHVAEDIDRLQILGFKCFQVCRKKHKFGRKHGGIAVFVHDSLLTGVSKIPSQGSDSIILKLNSVFFNLEEDIYLVFTYCSPANSSYTLRNELDFFSEIEQKLNSLGQNAQILLLGDLNARTGSKLDYISDEENKNLSLPDDYVTDTTATYPRGNRDPECNKYGDSLISLCKTVPLRICNGRKSTPQQNG